MTPKQENLFYSSLFTLIAALITGALLFFGGTYDILWLVIVGFIANAVCIFISFADTNLGWWTTIFTALALAIFLIFRTKFSSISRIEAITNWFDASVLDVFYVARVLVLINIFVAGACLYNMLSAHSND